MMGIGSLLWGYDSGIFGTAQAQVYFTEQFKAKAPTLGAVVSTYPAGGAVGCLLSMPIGNYFGRRNTIRIGAVVSIIGTTFQTAAFNVPLLIAGRVIAGLAIGIIYFAIPMYMSELAPAEHRGLFVGLHAQFIGFGYALSNWIGFAVYYSSGAFTVCVSSPVYYLPLLTRRSSVFLSVCKSFLGSSSLLAPSTSRNLLAGSSKKARWSLLTHS
jgi:MFS family permease